MKTAIISTLMVGALTLATMNSAAAETVTTKKLNPWTDCGIGAMIFTSSGAAAAISNVIWDLGTTAVSSNVSSQNSCGSEQAKTAMFIQATLPVLEQARDELLDWQQHGMSLMEMSHRSPQFQALASETEADLRELLNIPSNYKVLFLPGGAQIQFSMIPMNFQQTK